MYDKADAKLKESYLKLNNTIQINNSLQQELRTKNITIDQLQKQKQQLEDRFKEVKEENVRYQRHVIKGPKGMITAEQNKDLRDRLKQLEAERDQYEGYYNKAQYELKQREYQIKTLESAIVSKFFSIL